MQTKHSKIKTDPKSCRHGADAGNISYTQSERKSVPVISYTLTFQMQKKIKAVKLEKDETGEKK